MLRSVFSMTTLMNGRHGALIAALVMIASVTIGGLQAAGLQQTPAPSSEADANSARALLDRYCVSCHNERVVNGRDSAPSPLASQLRAVGLTLDTLDPSSVGRDLETWETVVRKLRAGVMPPAGRPRPDDALRDAFLARLETDLDAAWAARAELPRTAIFHRVNRAEYANVIRDLLALDIDVAALLPSDDASYGFDNIADALGVSPLLLERYLTTARHVSRLAVGRSSMQPSEATYLAPLDLTQDGHVPGLPLGTRGGLVATHQFPLDAEYIFQMRLRRSVIETIRGLAEPHQIEVSIDGERVQLFTIGGEFPCEGININCGTGNVNRGDRRGNAAARRAAADAALDYAMFADAALEVRVPVTAGPHTVAVAFLKKTDAVFDSIRRPVERSFVDPVAEGWRPPHLRSVTISGPYDGTGPGTTPSRDRIFVCRPAHPDEEAACAKRIIETLARRAYRRPVTDADLRAPLEFYEMGRAQGSFDDGIGRAVQRLLVHPEFLFRVERDPVDSDPDTAYPLNDLELASRLSFFLWSSMPDDELLEAADAGRLTDAGVLEQQVRRMLGDERSRAFVSNFGGQWLYTRNMQSALPDPVAFPDFNDNLRQAMRQETELFFEDVIREDRSVLEFLTSDTTFLNERLARHYGVPNVAGSHFRRVSLPDGTRGGVLGHGSVLTATSYANRTSPVTRGKWILENLLGAPPPPPPPDVPELEETAEGGGVLSMRERMEQHRKNPSCAVCHAQMDPLGLALENYDAVGRWRVLSESNQPIDATGALPDGSAFDGPAGLRNLLAGRSGEFVTTMTEKLLTYALGRGVELADAPVVRQIVRRAERSEYRFASIIMGVVESQPFRMRRSLP